MSKLNKEESQLLYDLLIKSGTDVKINNSDDLLISDDCMIIEVDLSDVVKRGI